MATETKTKKETVEFDAKNKILGRLATEVASRLRGKDKVDFAPHKEPDEIVAVFNISQIRVTGKKATQKMYWHHTGYPGGIKGISYEDLFKKDPTLVFLSAVHGMLPTNKLRARMLKRLHLYAGEIETK